MLKSDADFDRAADRLAKHINSGALLTVTSPAVFLEAVADKLEEVIRERDAHSQHVDSLIAKAKESEALILDFIEVKRRWVERAERAKDEADAAQAANRPLIAQVASLSRELADLIEQALDGGLWDYGDDTKLAWIDRHEDLTGKRWQADEDEFDYLEEHYEGNGDG